MEPLGKRLTFVTGSGPDGSGSKSNEFLPHMPDKSGIGAVSAAAADEAKLEDERKTAVASWRYRLGTCRIANPTNDIGLTFYVPYRTD